MVNFLVLLELVRRSADRVDLLDDMHAFIGAAYANCSAFERQQDEDRLIIE